MSLYFCPLYSGSSGNALYVSDGETSLLIDAGLSGKIVENALNQIGVSADSLGGILITHEHSDHVKGVGVLSRRYHLPVYATHGTWSAMECAVGEVPCGCGREFEGDFYLNRLEIHPFEIPHDAAQPCGYRVTGDGCSIAVATDIGYFSRSVQEGTCGADLVLLESNFEPDMLLANPHYSAALKHRIRSRHGHLSNEESGEAALTLYSSGVRNLILGHMSGENNLPELAYRVVSDSLRASGVEPGRDIVLDLAYRHQVGEVYILDKSSQEE